MAASCPLLGDGITDDILLRIAGFLPTAGDLLNLGLTCPRFAAKIVAAAPNVGVPEILSLVEEVGRLWMAGRSEQERGWVPRLELESWLCLMQEVELLRVPLFFGRAHADMTLTEDGAVATRNHGNVGTFRTAASKVVMRSGRHFAQFTVVAARPFFGVIRPGWDVEGGERARRQDDHCFYSTRNGLRYPDYRDWEGRKKVNDDGTQNLHAEPPQGASIGMLLDLDQGSMTVWKNDVKLGIMVAEGLVGPLCWAVSMLHEGANARIESAPASPSPTEKELAVAQAWQAAHPR